MNELENNEFTKALEEAVGRFFELDAACEKVKEKEICDVVGVKCDASCKIYVRKEKWLNVLIGLIKAETFHEPMPVALPERVPEPEPETSKEKTCPSCGAKAPLPESKYCHVCGEEF